VELGPDRGTGWPGGLGTRFSVSQPETEKAHEREPVVDQELGAVVAKIVLHLNDQDLEHHHRVKKGGRPSLAPSPYLCAATSSGRHISKIPTAANAPSWSPMSLSRFIRS
jgi:hypothetical protein